MDWKWALIKSKVSHRHFYAIHHSVCTWQRHCDSPLSLSFGSNYYEIWFIWWFLVKTLYDSLWYWVTSLCDDRLHITHLWKSSIQWIWLVASTVNGIPSRLFPQTTQVKQAGWYGFPVARSSYGDQKSQVSSLVPWVTGTEIRNKFISNPSYMSITCVHYRGSLCFINR